jgi:hypothetical protein
MPITITASGETKTLQTGTTLLSSNFDTATIANPVSLTDASTAMGVTLTGSSTFVRTSIVPIAGRGNVWSQAFTAGKFSTSDGIALYPQLKTACDEASITYDVRFNSAGTPWGKGGKLPGLGGAKPGTGNPPSGGQARTTGWSGRLMWLTPAAGYSTENPLSPVELVGYFYGPMMGAGYGKNLRTRKTLVTNQWHRITSHYRMNTIKTLGVEGNADGLYEIYVDGALAYQQTNAIYRLYPDANITHLVWDNFYGGATIDWAPTANTAIQYDNLTITTP